MTTTVTVRTRAWPARVTSVPGGDQPDTATEVAAHSEQSFHVTGAASIQVQEIEPQSTAAEETTENARPFEGEAVPGAAENDKLVPRFGRKTPADAEA